MNIGILSDIHGNHYALEQTLIEAKKRNIGRFLVLGDIVGYYYHPDKVMSMLDHWDYEIIKGNHEVLLAKLLSGEIDNNSLQVKYGKGHRMAADKLSSNQIQKLINLPEKKRVAINGVNILMCHGSNWDPNFYMYPDSSTQDLDKCNEEFFDFVLIGHSHYPFVYRNKNSTLINVGSVGQSRLKGGVANWAIINTINKCFELISTPYNVNLIIDEVKTYDAELPYLHNILRRNNYEEGV